jgi:uncharacterized membrane protein
MDSVAFIPEQTRVLTEQVEAWNEKLRSAASVSAERAFGIGCSLGLVPVLIVVLVLYSLRIMNLILGVLVGLLSVMFLVGVASLLSSIARSNTLKRTYQDEVDPQISQFIAQMGLPRQQFDTLAFQILPEGAPLQLFLHPIPPEPTVEAPSGEQKVGK